MDLHLGQIRIGTDARHVWVNQSDYFAFCDRIANGAAPPQRLNSLRGLFNQHIPSQTYDASGESPDWFAAGFELVNNAYPAGSLVIE
jgi:hypothetical protein